jgi:hypothetical protein
MDWERCGHWYNTDNCWSRQVIHIKTKQNPINNNIGSVTIVCIEKSRLRSKDILRNFVPVSLYLTVTHYLRTILPDGLIFGQKTRFRPQAKFLCLKKVSGKSLNLFESGRKYTEKPFLAIYMGKSLCYAVFPPCF